MKATFLAKVLIETNNLSHNEWLEYRKQGIGGSDIAAICGLSKWKKAIHVYLEKIGEAPQEELSEAAEWGILQEPLIADKFARNHPEWAITEQKAIYINPEFPWALGNLDRMVICPVRGRGILEIKTASEYLKAQWDNGNIPDYYYVQLQWYFFVTGLEWGYFATLIGGNKYREYEVYRDDELIEQLVRLANVFWDQHVMPRQAPALDGSDACSNLLNQLYPKADQATMIELDIDKLIENYFSKKNLIKELEDEQNEMVNQIKGLMGENEAAKSGSYLVKWENRSKTSIDSKRLKKSYPEIYETFQKTSSYRHFSIK
jgi:putative phage-type endonuclease